MYSCTRDELTMMPALARKARTFMASSQRPCRLQLRADCNRGGAGYAAGANRSLTMTPAATTKMGCPSGSKGTEFVRQLAEVSGYDFVDGDLLLTLKSNAGAMRFTSAAK